MKTIAWCFFSLLNSLALFAQQEPGNAKLEWFRNAKLGIFIHTGIYAVNGVDESWSFFNRKISHAAYMNQLPGFTLNRYDPAYWARLIQESGARYAVITTKHHDGVAMYDTKMNNLSIVQQTPAGRDMIGPFFNALRKLGIKCGAYFSLIDWSHPDYPGFIKDSTRYTVAGDPARWQRFRHFFQGQIAELSQQFNPDLFWFDGDWEHSADEWEAPKVRAAILQHNPAAIINGRLQGYGDYATPEQNFPVTRPAMACWELCMTTNNNWGFQHADTNWKTPYEIITIFADVVSNGGNLLLDMGPKADGTIPAEQVHILQELGAWNRRHSEAIFNTLGGLPAGHYYGPTTLSADSATLYLFLPAQAAGKAVIKGLLNKVNRVTVLGTGAGIGHKVVGKISWSPVPGLVYINAVPQQYSDKYMTVLKLELDGPVRLYNGSGGL